LDYSVNSNNDTTLTGINAGGQAVGFTSSTTGIDGFRLTGGSGVKTGVNDLNPGHGSNSGETHPLSINDNGIVVGTYGTSLGIWNFKYDIAANTYTDITITDSVTNGNALVTGINNNGWLVGSYDANVTGHNEGFLYDGSTFTTITAPNADAASDGTFVTGINNLGLIVGYFRDANYYAHGFVYDGVTKTFLNTQVDNPNASGSNHYTDLRGINDLGQVVGTYLDANSTTHGFIATPTAVPVPAAVWLFGSALAGLGITGKRRKAMLTA